MSQQINKETIKQYMEENKYVTLTFSPEKNDFAQTLPHNNYVEVYYLFISTPSHDKYETSFNEIKETDTHFLAELFRWAKKQGIKKIRTEHDFEVLGRHYETGLPVSYKFVVRDITMIKITDIERERERERESKIQTIQMTPTILSIHPADFTREVAKSVVNMII